MLEHIYMLDKSVANEDFEILSYTSIMKINMNESKYYMSAWIDLRIIVFFLKHVYRVLATYLKEL